MLNGSVADYCRVICCTDVFREPNFDCCALCFLDEFNDRWGFELKTDDGLLLVWIMRDSPSLAASLGGWYSYDARLIIFSLLTVVSTAPSASRLMSVSRLLLSACS